MAQISWDESAPSDSDQYSGMAAALRSLKSNIATGLSTLMYWPGSGGGSFASAGQLLPHGSARAVLDSGVSGPGSGSSYSNNVGALLIGAPARLYEFGSTVTRPVGSNLAVENRVAPTTNTRWVMDSGVATAGRAAFNVTYGAPPAVQAVNADGTNLATSIGTVITSSASLILSTYTGFETSSGTVHWISLGTVSF